MRLVVLATVAIATSACGDSDPLDEAYVKSIPAGDATGDSYSGSYLATLTPKSCSGQCATSESSNVCIENEFTIGINIDQSGGVLTVETMSGGVFADGSFEVGTSELNSDDTKTLQLMRGFFPGDGTFYGNWYLRAIQGDAVDSETGETKNALDCQMTLGVDAVAG